MAHALSFIQRVYRTLPPKAYWIVALLLFGLLSGNGPASRFGHAGLNIRDALALAGQVPLVTSGIILTAEESFCQSDPTAPHPMPAGQVDCGCCLGGCPHSPLLGVPQTIALDVLKHSVEGRAPPSPQDPLIFFHLRLRPDPRGPPVSVLI